MLIKEILYNGAIIAQKTLKSKRTEYIKGCKSENKAS
jgi:hypothetical protein